MITVKDLREAYTGMGNGSSFGEIAFHGTMVEAVAEFDYQLMLESISMQKFMNESDDIMIEAVVNGTSAERMEVLSEGVFQTFLAKAKKVLKKLVEMLKGLWSKVKAFFLKLTGQTTKWAKEVEPSLNKAPTLTDFSVTMHNWKLDKFDISKLDKADEYMDHFNASVDLSKAVTDDAPDLTESKEEALKDVCDRIGIDADSASEVTGAVYDMLSGGSTEEVTLTGDFAPKTMMVAIKGFKKAETTTSAFYNKRVALATKMENAVDKAEKAVNKEDGDDVANKVANLNYLLEISKFTLSIENNAISGFMQANRTAINEFMTAITKYIAAANKSKKNK